MENIQQKEIDNEQAIRDKSEADNKILAKISQELGWLPKPLKILAKRPGSVETFMTHRNQIWEGGPLSKKENSLIALATAITIQSATCIRTHAKNARKAGAQEDEIIQTMLNVSLMAGISSLHLAYGALSEEE
jgi:AhpD family alkylhydroperoxidase